MADQRAVLADALGVVRKRIQQIRERKEILGEQNTKATLIEPVLGALGWDLQEIEEVRREYKRKPQDNPVDYALFLNRTECLFVEAKSLEKDLSERKWVSQNLAYATVVGVQWCVLTNGDEYRIYNSHAAVDVDEKLFRCVRVSGTETKLLIDTLVLLSKEMMRGSLLDEMWKAHFIDKNVRTALENLPDVSRFNQTGALHVWPAQYLNSAVRVHRKTGDAEAYAHNIISRMAGTLSFNGDIAQWSPAAAALAREQVEAYKEFRNLLAGPVYFPLEQPRNDREWDVVVFGEQRQEQVLLAFRKQGPARVFVEGVP